MLERIKEIAAEALRDSTWSRRKYNDSRDIF